MVLGVRMFRRMGSGSQDRLLLAASFLIRPVWRIVLYTLAILLYFIFFLARACSPCLFIRWVFNPTGLKSHTLYLNHTFILH
ncbi:hypothetical protein A3841_00110 [Pontibacter flavimaris]|uniref:Uncharacterized protein n=1 Tax=Pontibacter flavimaris TaxID=1797110 RepID=A0A1Q5PBR4_9BACT|nr:hypothetical protein A3841_00110 [Pontibacter flavimaris]